MKKLDSKSLKTVSGGTLCGGISISIGGCQDSCGGSKSKKGC